MKTKMGYITIDVLYNEDLRYHKKSYENPRLIV